MEQNTITQGQSIQDYIPLVDFLGNFLGKDCEVVLHDTSRVERSVLAIANGHISGRTVGAPLTDLALSIVREKKYVDSTYIMEYDTVSRDGKRLHSATYFIKDPEGELLGMICLNMDVTKQFKARELLNLVIGNGGYERVFAPEDPVDHVGQAESFHDNIEELTENIIQAVISQYSIPADRLTSEEKLEIVGELNRRGVFLIKGSVSVVAKYLASSEATVYRYMQKTQDA
ncbi:helix-turn-helix transcriptional regulator [Desulfobaculum bizertense]|uniref:Predicted transcriptional regulator YheO, contains PAS and DNA-binding HTH domains n=1 Tax=Desulfobaculum bizertense DSM 18034 TaxID=1121442 RepID=A0A1T4WYY7_9BACT|nr:PAS domain-containing protein [Desulfobaculum bizertense]SKA82572.1 Predicted transcriptional regulator YheO, contains PAS and DNA-binding HTH domains [Desulfobaculum bizertense DSM 18034]